MYNKVDQVVILLFLDEVYWCNMVLCEILLLLYFNDGIASIRVYYHGHIYSPSPIYIASLQ